MYLILINLVFLSIEEIKPNFKYLNTGLVSLIARERKNYEQIKLVNKEKQLRCRYCSTHNKIEEKLHFKECFKLATEEVSLNCNHYKLN
jgi:hypothetical protein